jgi:RNA polymerase sigma factor (sigma-70 family)
LPGGRATDRDLIERFVRDGSEGAFADLMARHGAMVRAVCRRHLRDAHAADDAFQATFLVLFRKAGQVRWRECIGGWLFEVATRVARKAAGQAVRRSAREGAPADSSREPAAPAPASDLTALQVALDEELGRLPEKFRTPLVLCHLEGLSQDEVARQLGVTDGQLRGRLYRAKERLRRRLESRGFSLTAVLLALALGPPARAIPATLTAGTRRLATAAPHTIPVAVRLLATGVIQDMTTKFKLLALLALLGAVGLAVAGFASRVATTDPAGREPAPPAPDAAREEPAPVKPGVADKESGAIPPADADKDAIVRVIDLEGFTRTRTTGVASKPTRITNAEELAKAFPDSDEEWLDRIARQVDFEKDELLFFAWTGSSTDGVSFKVEQTRRGPVVVFSFKQGRGQDMPRPRFRLYAIARNWRIESTK